MREIVEAARSARKNAHAPYSGYAVGAAVRDSQGHIWSGCNVENVSYPLSVCAERNAVAAMVRDGGRNIVEVAVVTEDGETPCGGCLQVLLEFSEEPSSTVVRAVSEAGPERSFALAELIPHGFHRCGTE